jgi:hypothetical protein
MSSGREHNRSRSPVRLLSKDEVTIQQAAQWVGKAAAAAAAADINISLYVLSLCFAARNLP